MMKPSSPRSRLYSDGPQVVALRPLGQRWMLAPFVVGAGLLIGLGSLGRVGLLGLDVMSALGLSAGAALCTAIISFFVLRRENCQRKVEFLAALEELDLATLRHSVTSPLIDEVSRRVLVTYLNQRYPGWIDQDSMGEPTRRANGSAQH